MDGVWGGEARGAAVSNRVVQESPTEKRPEGRVHSITRVSCLLCVRHYVRHCGGSPGNISFCHLLSFTMKQNIVFGLHVTEIQCTCVRIFFFFF